VTGRILAILRGDHEPDIAHRIGQVLVGCGITAVEVTTNSRHAAACIGALATIRELQVGAGTVVDTTGAQQARAAGARFLVTPVVGEEAIGEAARDGVPVIAGALSPTEMWRAWCAGAATVKLFPAACVGPEYLSAVRGPFPQIAVVPTGGVDDTNAAAYLRLGAVAVAAGSWLVPARSVDLSLEQLADRAGRLREAVDAVPVSGVE
jgi:2-dehydro-3-deoxyphosphogluconate aldolase/(4S)-4-hydroxy-2-oxoglutarate aldolase